MSSRIDVDEIRSKTTNGNLSIQPNGTGMIVPQRPVFFQVEATDIDQSVSAGSNTTVQWETVQIDTGGYWDSTNHRYTPQVAGWYQFWGSVRYAANRAQYVALNLEKNGSRVHMVQLNSGDVNTINFSNGSIPVPVGLVLLNGSTDYVDLKFEHKNAATVHDAGTVPSLFGGMLVHAT